MNGALLINLGTPDEPTTPALRRYLREFLSDPDVIDIAAPLRFLLVNAIIVPFRSPKSAHAYQAIWGAQGSPLRHFTRSLAEHVQGLLGPQGIHVDWGMRYGNPGLLPALERLRAQGVVHLTVAPLYPQFAQSTVGSTLTHINQLLGKMHWNPRVHVVQPFYQDQGFLEAQAALIRPLLFSTSGTQKHLLLSFHGIPERHVLKSSPDCVTCLPKPGCERLEHRLCYRGQSYETAHGIARALGLTPHQYSVSFQSRLGKQPWIRPFTDFYLETLVKKGIKHLVVACPSFVSDCLETLEEIGVREKERFLSLGGETLELAPCVNDSKPWTHTVAQLIQSAHNPTDGGPHAGTPTP